MHRSFSAALFAVFLICLNIQADKTGSEADFSQVVEQASRIIIMDNGRAKPLATYARYTLYRLSGRFSYRGESAAAWLCKTLFTPQRVQDDAVFLINNPEVADAIGIPSQKKRRYTCNQLVSGLGKLDEEMRKFSVVEPSGRSIVETELLRTAENAQSFFNLCGVFSFAMPAPEFTVMDSALATLLLVDRPGTALSFYSLRAKSKLLARAMKIAGDKPRGAWTATDSAAVALGAALYDWASANRVTQFSIIPVEISGELRWMDPWSMILDKELQAENDPAIDALVKAAECCNAADYAHAALALAAFNTEVGRRIAGKGFAPHSSMELTYNAIDPFSKANLAYFFALALIMAGLLSRFRRWLVFGSAILAIGFLVHTYGLIARIIIMNRPPVTTLYETFVFVAWVSTLLGLLLEIFQKKRFGLLISAFTGALFLYFAGKFGADGDTMGMLAPVLNNNFWLTTHIMTISMGYAGCIGAGVLAHLYLIQRKLQGQPLEKTSALASSIYGMLAFGLTFTTIGTVLGGLWADQAWGRFWGWDPKENGALLIILWCAMILHARRGKIISETGTALCAVIGLALVMLAWLGVNLLGIGMHAYGFTGAGSKILFATLIAEALFLAFVAFRSVPTNPKQKATDGK